MTFSRKEYNHQQWLRKKSTKSQPQPSQPISQPKVDNQSQPEYVGVESNDV